jgi:hypothetical protein
MMRRASFPVIQTMLHTLPTDRRKCGAECVAFCGEGAISVPSPVKEIVFEKKGQAQEQSALCAAHLAVIGYRPAL